MFKEASRITAHDGSVHVHSVAYEQIKDYLEKYAHIEEIKAEIAELHRQIANIAPDLRQAEEAMLEALFQHYDGRIPDYVEFSSAILRFGEDAGVEVIRPSSYCDLYRIERPATPQPSADE